MTINWLLIFLPIAIVLEHVAPERALWIFAASALAIMPLAGWMGKATEQLAERTGEGIGGLLNATFGNAAELIIARGAARALHRGGRRPARRGKGIPRGLDCREYSTGAWSINARRGVESI